MGFSNFIFSNIFILIFLPIWVAFLITLNFTVPSFRSKKFTLNLTLISTGICLVYSAILLYITASTGAVINDNILNWLRINNLNFSFGFVMDNLTALFLVIFNSISFLIQLYSNKYLQDDECFHRYFVYLNLFNFSLSGLLISINLIQSYLFIELISVCIYLISSFWYKKIGLSIASQKSLILNKIGDYSFLLGLIFLISFAINSDTDISILNFYSFSDLGQSIIPYTSNAGFCILCMLFFIGIIAKSAQFPLHTWLIEGTEMPLPTYTLLCSSTTGIVGLYLLTRFLPIFNLSDITIQIIFWLCLFFSIFCAFISIFQNNIKKVFAYLTSSQIGLIISAIIIGGISSALLNLSIFTYSITLLLLVTGVIILIYNSSDLRIMGGLRKNNLHLTIFFVIGLIGLSGIFIGGFLPKEQILSIFIEKKLFFEYGLILLSSFLTTLSCTRVYLLTCERNSNKEILYKKLNKKTIIFFSILSLPVLFLGLFLIKSFYLLFDVIDKYNLSFLEIIISATINLIAVLLVFLLFKFNLLNKLLPEKLNKVFEKGFYIDKIYTYISKTIYQFICNIANFTDKFIISGIFKIISLFIKLQAVIISKLQNGRIQFYLASSLFGILMALIFIVFYYFKLKGL